MKHIQLLSGVLLTILALTSSCTMEKRVYLSGYHMEWLNNKRSEAVKRPDKVKAEERTEKEITVNAPEETVTASTDKSILVSSVPKIDLQKDKTIQSRNKSISQERTIIKAVNAKIKKKVKNALEDGERKSSIRPILIIGGGILFILGLLIALSAWGVPSAAATYAFGRSMAIIGGILNFIGFLMPKR